MDHLQQPGSFTSFFIKILKPCKFSVLRIWLLNCTACFKHLQLKVPVCSVLFPKRLCPSMLMVSLGICFALAGSVKILGASGKALAALLTIVREKKQSSRNLGTVLAESCAFHLTHGVSWKDSSFPRRPNPMEQQVFGQPGWRHSLTPRHQHNTA